MLNKLLQRQVQKYLGDPETIPGELAALLKAVSDSYDHFEKDRKMLERSIDLSSQEMITLNEQLKKDIRARIESENRYRLVHDTPFLGIALGTGDGRIQSTNEAFCRMLGYAPEELVDAHFSKFTHPDDVEKELVLIKEMAAGKTDGYQLEKRYVTKSGTILFIALSISCARDRSGQIEYVIAVVQDVTKRKAAEEQLEQTIKRFRQAEAIGRLGYWEVNLLTGESTWSDEAFCIYGLNPGEVNPDYELFLSYVHPDDLEMVKAVTGESMKTLNPFSVHHRIIDAKGRHKSLMATGHYELDANGKPVRLFGISLDVSELKEKEMQLVRAEANLRNLFENTETAYVLLDNEAKIISYNRLAKELATDEMQETLEEGKNYIKIMHPERQLDVQETIARVLRDKTPAIYDVKYVHGLHGERWLHVSMQPVVKHDGEVLGLSVGATDISSQKKAEQALKLSNERYELVTKATNDVIWDWDIINNKMYRSENYAQVFGYPGADEHSEPEVWTRRIHPDDYERVVEQISETVKDKNALTWEAEYRYRKTDGEYAYVQDRSYIIQDEQQTPIRMVGAMRDITSEKLNAIEREKITSGLIRQNKDLEQFGYIVSHNLRAPVVNILGLAKIINEPGLPKDHYQQCMEGILISAQKLDQVIMDLNQILRVRREMNELKETVCFSSLVEDIKASISDTIRAENVRIRTDFSSVDEIYALKSYLYSILYNLISNSIKYRTEENPVIDIRSFRTEEGITLVVKDNGAGIDLNRHGKQLFGLYKRFHPSKEGKGIGLFMVKSQVETLGGIISVKSEPGKGTEFTIEFQYALSTVPVI